MKNVKIGMDLFGEKNGPSIVMEFDVYRNNYIDVIKRGGKIRFITEVTNENLHYCKELKKIVTEMRHLDGLVGGIAVSGLSDLIRYKKGDIEQYAGLIDVIARNAKRLQRLTEDILDVSRIENRSLRLSKEKFSLRDMMEHATAEYKGIKIRDKRDIDVRLNISASNDDNILVYADRERIARVIDNLLINATKFTKEGAITVTITTTEGTDRSDKRGKTAITNAVVSIMDTGEGIDPQIYPRLFTKFATTSHVGTGLGLFISKNIIEAHGGKIWAQNNSTGKGATFSFSLPSTIT